MFASMGPHLFRCGNSLLGEANKINNIEPGFREIHRSKQNHSPRIVLLGELIYQKTFNYHSLHPLRALHGIFASPSLSKCLIKIIIRIIHCISKSFVVKELAKKQQNFWAAPNMPCPLIQYILLLYLELVPNQ